MVLHQRKESINNIKLNKEVKLMKESTKEMHEEELNFLKEELKKINAKIKESYYGGRKEDVEAQIKLWELREKIKEIYDQEDSYEEDREI